MTTQGYRAVHAAIFAVIGLIPRLRLVPHNDRLALKATLGDT